MPTPRCRWLVTGSLCRCRSRAATTAASCGSNAVDWCSGSSSPRLGVPCAFGFRASPDIWRKYMSQPPEPLYHDVFAMLMRVPGFVLEGDSLVAMQHARALHRVMKVMRQVGRMSLEPIVGRYLSIRHEGARASNLLRGGRSGCAAAVSAYGWRGQPAIPAPAERCCRHQPVPRDRVRSPVSRPIDATRTAGGCSKYRLTTSEYLSLTRAVWKALSLERPVVLGCSMGGAIVLKLAAEYQQELRGIVGLESTALCAGALQRVPASSRDSWRRDDRVIHLRTVCATESRSQRA